jgi:hypothetical protein
MRIPFKRAIGTAMAAAGVVALSTSPASATSHGSALGLPSSISGCTVHLYYNSSTKWAYARVDAYGIYDKCHGFVHNTHNSKSWTPITTGEAWSGGVWRGSGYKAQACVYAYVRGVYKGWTCTSWH